MNASEHPSIHPSMIWSWEQESVPTRLSVSHSILPGLPFHLNSIPYLWFLGSGIAVTTNIGETLWPHLQTATSNNGSGLQGPL